jgi:hypothetical protein
MTHATSASTPRPTDPGVPTTSLADLLDHTGI